ncbi:MAG TPA: peptide chain release factor 2 [Rhodothermia bacterium]
MATSAVGEGLTRQSINELLERARMLGGYLDVASRQAQIDELEKRRLREDFWSNPQEAARVEKEIAAERSWVDDWAEVTRSLEDLETLIELADEEDSGSLENEIQEEAVRLGKLVEQLEMRNMLQDEDDTRNAIITITPGAGGTESQDWADMLFRMYVRYGESHKFDVAVLEYQPGEGAGIKSATIRMQGPFAYGYMKAESGVHRLVRISPFDSSGRRHTSFASVFVYPEIDESIQVDVIPDDVEMQRFHSGGKGGQNVNKVETGVRLIWTGDLSNGEEARVVAECTEERSQLQNREKAMVLLKSRIYQLEREIREAAKNEREKSKKKIEWGSQIRSYVFQPYTMVNDHRTELKSTDVYGVMDGDLDAFIKACLMAGLA